MSLRNRVLIFVAAVVVLLVGSSLVVVHWFAGRQVEVLVRDDLFDTRSVFEEFMAERADWLYSQGWVVAEDPRFTATLDIADPDFDSQARTVLREAVRFQEIIGSDLFVVSGATGRTLARVVLDTDPGAARAAGATVERALSTGGAVEGTWRVGDADYAGVTVPASVDGSQRGTLSVGFRGSVDRVAVAADLEAWAAGTDDIAALGADPAAAPRLGRALRAAFLADLTVITDADGDTLATLRLDTGFGEEPSGLPGIDRALAGSDWTGFTTLDGRIFQLVVVPVWSQDAVVGALATGFRIDDVLAASLREMTRSEVSFVDGGRVLASTWPEPFHESLLAATSSATAGPAGVEAVTEAQMRSATYLTLAGELPAQEEGATVYVIQRSLDEAMGFLRTMERLLLVIAGGVFICAAAASFWGVGRVVRPLRDLVEATRRLAAGDLSGGIPVRSQDEIGELADSFNGMARALRSSREALAESERRYRDLFDNARDVVFTTDAELCLTGINKAGEELFDRTADELAGTDLHALFEPDEAHRVDANLGPPRAAATPPSFEVRAVPAGGEPATLEVVSRWIREGDAVVGVHGIARDISERRRREEARERLREQLAHSEKLRALGEMAAGVAHNFNNLLTGILGNAQLLATADDVADGVRERAGRIAEAARGCASVVRRIQSFGRPAADVGTESVDLPELIESLIDITRPKWKTEPEREGRDIRLELDIADVPPFEGVRTPWEEILSNLVFNAVDAMPDGGTLRVACRVQGRTIVLSVSDTGSGIDERLQRRIFEPFFTTKDASVGTGLGLSTVWGLVNGLGGTIDVDSAPGRGTTFTVAVPLPSAGRVRERESRSAEGEASLRILVVDDEPGVLGVISQMLGDHRVETVETAAAALERFGDDAFDVVISDWSMPGSSGLELAAELRQRDPGVVFVLMTGWTTHETLVDDSEDVDLLLSKPMGLDDMRRVVSRAVELLEERQVRP